MIARRCDRLGRSSGSRTMKIYHNPKCTKSRQTLALLREHGAQPEVIEYLKTPPTFEELEAILSLLGLHPAELVRKKEAKELGVDFQTTSRSAAIQAMVENPRVIERPIVVCGERAAIGRPPEDVLPLLDQG